MGKKKCFDDQWIIITGAAGMIGSCLIRQLNDLGYAKNLILVDDFKKSIKWKNLYGKKYSEFMSRHELMQWLKGKESEVEAIIHMGANSSTTGTDGCEYYQLNYRYTIGLAQYAIENNIRFIYASSAATYGSGLEGFEDDIEQLDVLKPLNIYGQTKHMFDLWVHRNNLTDSVVGLKYFNVYGPNEYHKGSMASMVYHMYNQICLTGKVRLFKSNTDQYKDGEQQRDFIYVKDVAKITSEFLFNDVMGIFNVGNGVARSWNCLAKAVFSAVEKPVNIEYIPMPANMLKTYQNYTCADMQRITSKFTLPKTSLEEGVLDYVNNYLIEEERW